jgi:HSP20 family protein
MALVRFKPARDLTNFPDEMGRMMERFLGRDFAETANWYPRVDITETDDDIVIVAELPGVTKDDVKLTVQEGVLTIRGEKKASKEVDEDSYHRCERVYGSFSRSFTLPRTVASDKVKATFKDGLLKVSLPKAEEVKPKEIDIAVE